MGHKIFISYKYADTKVLKLNQPSLWWCPSETTTVRSYVDILQEYLKQNGNHINKGEKDNESLAGFSDETIASKLRDKIYDSTITIILNSKGMFDPTQLERNQWMPWEIAYSLRNKTRNDRTSSRNAILSIILPDEYGSYAYAYAYEQNHNLFPIICKNLNNLKDNVLNRFLHHSYINHVNWNMFMENPNNYIEQAKVIQQNEQYYNITTSL